MVAELIGGADSLEVVREGRLRELELVPAELES